MAKKITKNSLKRLVVETVNEIKREKRTTRNSKKQHNKALLESTRRALEVLLEEADPNKVDLERFPLKLTDAGQTPADVVDDLTRGGVNDGATDDDVVTSSDGGGTVKELKPSQTSMNAEKACCFALCAMANMAPFASGPGGDLSAIISNDNHIMDGHHRWVASGMVDPNVSVQGKVVEFPARPLINVLNMITVELTGRTEGKEGSGGFERFTSAGFLEILKDFASGGAYFMKKGARKNWDSLPAEKVQEICDAESGKTGEESLKHVADLWGTNMGELTTTVPAGFPTRPDMPVLSPKLKHVEKAVEMLKNGEVDLNPPYGEAIDATEGEMAPEDLQDNVQRKDAVIVERWNKLAGLLK